MLSLTEQQLQKRRRFVGWLNAGLFVFSTAVLLAVLLIVKEDLDVGVIAFAGAFCTAHIIGGVGCALGKRWGTFVLWPVSIIDLVGIPFGTLLGGYNLYILYETRDQVGISRRTLAIASVIPALLLAMALAAQFASDTDSERTAPLRAAIAAQGGTHEFQVWSSTLPKDSTQMATAIARLQAQGLLRLDSATQLAQVRLTADGLQRASNHDCASFGRGGATLDQQRAYTAGFDSADRSRLMEIKARAILAGLRDSTPVTTASDRDIDEYAVFIYQSLSPADQRRYQALANSIAAASDTDICWITRLYHSRAVVQHPSRSRWVSVVLSQAAGGNH